MRVGFVLFLLWVKMSLDSDLGSWKIWSPVLECARAAPGAPTERPPEPHTHNMWQVGLAGVLKRNLAAKRFKTEDTTAKINMVCVTYMSQSGRLHIHYYRIVVVHGQAQITNPQKSARFQFHQLGRSHLLKVRPGNPNSIQGRTDPSFTSDRKHLGTQSQSGYSKIHQAHNSCIINQTLHLTLTMNTGSTSRIVSLMALVGLVSIASAQVVASTSTSTSTVTLDIESELQEHQQQLRELSDYGYRSFKPIDRTGNAYAVNSYGGYGKEMKKGGGGDDGGSEDDYGDEDYDDEEECDDDDYDEGYGDKGDKSSKKTRGGKGKGFKKMKKFGKKGYGYGYGSDSNNYDDAYEGDGGSGGEAYPTEDNGPYDEGNTGGGGDNNMGGGDEKGDMKGDEKGDEKADMKGDEKADVKGDQTRLLYTKNQVSTVQYST